MKYLLIITTLISVVVSAGAHATTDDTQMWFNTNTTGKITDKVLGYGEIQPRLMNDWNELNSVLYRAAIGYSVTDKWSVWGGYGLVHWNYPTHYVENRPYLQSTYNFSYAKLTVSNRTRFEGRRLEDRPKTGLRLRHLLRNMYLLNEANKVYFVLWDELFYNFNTIPGVNHEGFDQNRVFTGIGHKFGDKLQHLFEGGYLNQYVVKYEKANGSNHALAFQYTYNF